MRETKYITPRLGLRSVAILGLMLIGTMFLITKSVSLIDAPFWESNVRITLNRWVAGILYGLAVGGCWLATIVKGRYLRWLLRAGIVVLIVAVKQELNSFDWLRDFANLGGLVLAQCMLFFWIRVPNWKMDESGLEKPQAVPVEAPTRQFGIGDIGITTTVVALLLATGIRYSPPIESLFGYWSVLALAWLIGPIIAACVAGGFLSRTGRLAMGMLATAILIAAGGVLGLVLADSFFADNRPAPSVAESQRILAALYGRVVGGYLVTVAIFAIAGRLQGSAESEIQARQDELDS